MMPPDTPPVSKETLAGTLKDSQIPSPYQSKVRALLGLPNSSAVPLPSAMSLPVVELPHVKGNREFPSPPTPLPQGEGRKGTGNRAGAEQGKPRPTQSPPGDGASDPEKETSPVTERPVPTTKRVQELLAATFMESDLPTIQESPVFRTESCQNPLVKGNREQGTGNRAGIGQEFKPRPTQSSPGDGASDPEKETSPVTELLTPTPQKISIHIPGITQPRTSSSLPLSVGNNSSRVGERNPAERSAIVDEEAPTNDNIASLPLGNQTQTPLFPNLQRKVASHPATSGLAHPATIGDSTSQADATDSQLNDRAALSKQGIEFGVKYGDRSESITNAEKPTLDLNAHPSKDRQTQALATRMTLTSEAVAKAPIAALAVLIPDTWQDSGASRSGHPTAHQMAAHIEKLERTVADLSLQVAAQKDFQQPVNPTFPQPSQPQVIIQRPASQPRVPRAFWERSYVSRLYRWSCR